MPYKKNNSGKMQYYDATNGRFTSNVSVMDKAVNVSARDYDKPLEKIEVKDIFSTTYQPKFFLDKQLELSKSYKEKDAYRQIMYMKNNFYSKYQKGIANKDNFFISTIGEFNEIEKPNREPDFISYKKYGGISSKYWYSKDGLIRESDHWGSGVASCDWFLKGEKKFGIYKESKCGFIKWEDLTQKTHIIYSDITNEKNSDLYLSNFQNTSGKGKYIINGDIIDYEQQWQSNKEE